MRETARLRPRAPPLLALALSKRSHQALRKYEIVITESGALKLIEQFEYCAATINAARFRRAVEMAGRTKYHGGARVYLPVQPLEAIKRGFRPGYRPLRAAARTPSLRCKRRPGCCAVEDAVGIADQAAVRKSSSRAWFLKAMQDVFRPFPSCSGFSSKTVPSL